MLLDYNKLLAQDQIDCSYYFPADKDSHHSKETSDEEDFDEEFGEDDQYTRPAYLECWARKYGATIFSLVGLTAIFSVVFYLAVKDLKAEKAQRRSTSLID